MEKCNQNIDKKIYVFACKSSLKILHGRWAMLGIPGVFIPEILVRHGGMQLSEPIWWEVGYAKLPVATSKTTSEGPTESTFKPGEVCS